MDQERRNEITAVLLFAFSLFLFLSIFTFSGQDLSFYTSDPHIVPLNATGMVGSYVGGILVFFVGKAAYVIPLLIMVWGISRLFQIEAHKVSFKLFGTIVLLVAVSSSLSMMAEKSLISAFGQGGLIGTLSSNFLIGYLGRAGAAVFISAMIVLSVLVATEFLILPVLASAFNSAVRIFSNFKTRLVKSVRAFVLNLKNSRDKISSEKEDIAEKLEGIKRQVEDARRSSFPRRNTVTGKNQDSRISSDPQIVMANNRTRKVSSGSARTAPVFDGNTGEEVEYKLPGLDLLNIAAKTNVKEREEVLRKRAAVLEKTLQEFGVKAKVVQINRGPVITLYELEPSLGTKVNRITSLSDNISLAMRSANIRIIAPLPGKGTIGIEVPNSKSELVVFRDVLETEEYREEKSALKLALGKDISGDPIITDLAKMPHLLVAGATGSGKTVCLNCIISSLLYSSTSEELKFIMIDPKRVELMVFDGIPHLVSPIVTNSKKAAGALNWVVNEMERRYEIFASQGVRNIEAYKESKKKDMETLPYIVVVVDELADLMMVSPQDVEGAIMRIAQLSRAAGIHMILATQRPSVNVVTGVIKANFPARISFKVASKVDSRTVLDSNGAEKLLGRGDMLIMDPGETSLIRGQCCLVEDREIRNVVEFIKEQAGPRYVEDVLANQDRKMSGSGEDRDELYSEALKIILDSKQASVSMIQRKLRVGYNRAARIIDEMEEAGIVGAYNGSKPREILISEEELTTTGESEYDDE
ncbi:MAG: DNA translocase FtsK [Candidatus Omnitrophota bacterium]